MKQILIATHGKMASGIRYTAELIAGKSEEITTIDAYVNKEDDLEQQLREYFEAHQNDRIIVFTDLMGGSVNQKLLGYAQKENVTLITGMNLPVLIQTMFAEEDVSEEELQELVEEARAELQLVGGQEKQAPEAKETPEGKEVPEGKAQASEKAPEMKEKAAKKEKEVQIKTDITQYENSAAKITALRIDDRLIHGQVAMTWTKHLRVQGIVVACDEAAGDDTQKMALKMAVPAGIKVLIKPVDEAIRVLNNEKASKMRILVLTRTVRDALKLKKHLGEVEFLNVGNVGRFDGIDMKQKRALTETIMLTKEEQDNLRELVQLAPKTCIQQVPNDEQKLAKDLIEKWN